MLKTVESFIREQDLIPPGSTVLCAVSGGADSVAMLHILYRLRDKLDFALAAAHYNHNLRGAESDRDQRFVEQFVRLCCGEHRRMDGTVLPAVALYEGSGDVAGQARLRGTGVEETARDMRYAFLRQAAQKAGAGLIATAHTASDNAETILFHLARGSGLRGLGGVLPRREEIIRPMLTVTRREVEDYLLHHCLPHMEDSSNFNDDYTRNRIRHQVLPVLEEVSPGFLARVADTAALLRADEACLTGLAGELAGRAVPREGGLAIEASVIASAPDPIASRCLRLLLGRLWGGDQNCSAVHLIHRREQFRGSRILAEAVKKRENIILHYNTVVEEITGEDKVTGLRLKEVTTGKETLLAAEGVFVAIGLMPDNGFFTGQLELDGAGYIRAGEDCRTNLPGVFAAGDTRTKAVRQIITAAADGAVAALGAAGELL